MTAPSPPAVPLHPRILVVEDENIVAKDLQYTLERLGYPVCAMASAGDEAVDKAMTHRPDLVLMDIRLRGRMDGIESAQAIRQRLDVPVVFLTAYADEATLNRAAAAEPYGYVLKPFDERELNSTIVMAMCKHRAFADLDRRVRERTEALARSEARFRQMQAVVELGLFALETPEVTAVVDRTMQVVADTLVVDHVALLELEPDQSHLVLRAGRGWDADSIGTLRFENGPQSQSGFTLDSAEAVVADDLLTETRFRVPQVILDAGLVSAVTVVVHGASGSRPLGVLAVHTRTRRSFSAEDVHFLQAVANTIATCQVRARAEERARLAQSAADQERLRTEQAEQAALERDEFVAVVAHELRTPLQTLALSLDLMRKQLTSAAAAMADDVLAVVDRSVRQTGRLAELVQRLLDVSRITIGQFDLRAEEVDVLELVQAIGARFQEKARVAGCELRISVPDNLLARWDTERVAQAIEILLSNALKYGAGKPVEITVQGADGLARIMVRDHGIGISEVDVARIFGRFTRASSVANYGGLGLGLYIARAVAHAHGGTIDVASVPGDGATFVLELPLDVHARNQDAHSCSARTILLVDDDPDFRLTLAEILQMHGYDTLQAGNGREGLEHLRERDPPCLILLDLMMPVMDGMEFRAEQLRHPRARSVPVVILTAHGEATGVAKDLGTAAVLDKPVELEKLLATVERLCSSA